MDVEATEVGKRPYVWSKQSCHGMEHYLYLECIMLLNYLILSIYDAKNNFIQRIIKKNQMMQTLF